MSHCLAWHLAVNQGEQLVGMGPGLGLELGTKRGMSATIPKSVPYIMPLTAWTARRRTSHQKLIKSQREKPEKMKNNTVKCTRNIQRMTLRNRKVSWGKFLSFRFVRCAPHETFDKTTKTTKRNKENLPCTVEQAMCKQATHCARVRLCSCVCVCALGTCKWAHDSCSPWWVSPLLVQPVQTWPQFTKAYALRLASLSHTCSLSCSPLRALSRRFVLPRCFIQWVSKGNFLRPTLTAWVTHFRVVALSVFVLFFFRLLTPFCLCALLLFCCAFFSTKISFN